MKKFKFKLQRLLDIREAREKEIQNEMAVLLNIQNIERIKQEEYKSKIALEHENFNLKLKEGRFSYTDALNFERFIQFSHRVIDVAQERIDGMEPDIQRVRDRLIEASREKKVTERLKEKRLKDFNYQLNSELAKENDDLNQKIFMRRRAENA